MVDDEDGLTAYGKWHSYTIESNAHELNASQNHLAIQDISKAAWPDWKDGVPDYFCIECYCPHFLHKGVFHRPTTKTVSLELNWQGRHSLDSIEKNKRLLPSNHSSHWSGVYRLYSTGSEIRRCCGNDTTGTLYIGRACSLGQKGRNWSVLRTRISSIVRKEHHAMNSWRYNKKPQEQFPWLTLAVEWAYTEQKQVDYDGKIFPEAVRAEHWLLNSYNDTFGEYPPLNQRG